MAEEKKWTWRTPSWVESHIDRYLSGNPDEARMWDASGAGFDAKVQTLLLTTKGRKSGEPRHAPLIYVEHGGGYAIVASKGGFPQHPMWYLNLQVNPDVEIRVGAKTMKAKARTIHGPERAKIWAEAAKLYPPYDDYQKRAADREIPVVMLDPVN